MYSVDERDEVIELGDLPQSSVGAPLPTVVANEQSTAVAFYLQNTPAGWDGSWVDVITEESDEPWAIVVFDECYAQIFGPPNDEVFSSHPLASRGLAPYGSYFIRDSSWLRQLERRNSIHRQHDPAAFMRRSHHFVLTFHDSTFECIAANYRVVAGVGPLTQAVAQMYPLVLGRTGERPQADYSPPPRRHLILENERTTPATPWWRFW